MAYHRGTGPQRPGLPVEPGGRSANAQLAQLRDNLLGGFGQGADAEQVRAHTRDRRRADATTSVFEQARSSDTDRPTMPGPAPRSRRGTPGLTAAVGGFLCGVLLTSTVRRRTR
ncbi:MAG: hypothetical protein ABIR83_07480 [Nakamurella sp.]